MTAKLTKHQRETLQRLGRMSTLYRLPDGTRATGTLGGIREVVVERGGVMAAAPELLQEWRPAP